MAIKLTTYYRSKDIPDLPGQNTFHSKDLFVVYENTKGYTPLLIVATDGDKVMGKILAAIRKKTTSFIIPTVFKKCEVYGCGEYFCEKEESEILFGELLKHLTREALRKCFLIEFRNLGNPLVGYKHFKDNLFFAVNWLRVRNKLQTEGPIEKEFSQSRIRQIRKALKNGAEVLEAKTQEEVEKFAVMLRKIYSTHIRKHYPSIEFFHHLKDIPQNKKGKRITSIYIVKSKNKRIGRSDHPYSAENDNLWFSGGMRQTYSSVYPGVLAVWMALKTAKEQGYEHLEFMDVGLPFKRHSYREFILRFGGQQSSTRRWFRFKWSWLNKLFRKLYE